MPKNKQERLSFLFQKYLQNTCSREELDEFWTLMNEVSEEDKVTHDIKEVWGQKNYSRHKSEDVEWQKVYRDIMSRAQNTEVLNATTEKRNFGRIWLAAASIILVVGVGLALYQGYQKPDELQIVKSGNTDIQAPNANRATIVLADGSKVFLDNLNNGEVAQQGNVKVVKLANGEIAYQSASGEILKEIKYNTLTNPRGSKVINITLADGSRVWLNAGSSITYPIAFVEKDRKVKLEGEGYFEVSRDKSKPFYVTSGSMEVKVLGTHFNINAYEGNDGIRTTLLEGSVMINASGKSATLKPGEQAEYQATGQRLQTSAHVDLEQVMAWKNGYFSFQDAGLNEIMQQISRWYDVDVSYEGTIKPRQFGGVIPRSSDLKTVLKILEVSSVHFRMEGQDGRKLIVIP